MPTYMEDVFLAQGQIYVKSAQILHVMMVISKRRTK